MTWTKRIWIAPLALTMACSTNGSQLGAGGTGGTGAAGGLSLIHI